MPLGSSVSFIAVLTSELKDVIYSVALLIIRVLIYTAFTFFSNIIVPVTIFMVACSIIVLIIILKAFFT